MARPSSTDANTASSDSPIESSPSPPEDSRDGGCLFCLAEIPKAAQKCRFCAEWQRPATHPQSPKKGPWEKFELVGRVSGILLIPLVLAILGFFFNMSLKKSDVDLRMVEVAVEVLGTDPDPKQSAEDQAMRNWAVDVINHHGEIDIPEDVKSTRLPIERKAIERLEAAYAGMENAHARVLALSESLDDIQATLKGIPSPKLLQARQRDIAKAVNDLSESVRNLDENNPIDKATQDRLLSEFYQNNGEWRSHEQFVPQFTDSKWLSASNRERIRSMFENMQHRRTSLDVPPIGDVVELYQLIGTNKNSWLPIAGVERGEGAFACFRQVYDQVERTSDDLQELDASYNALSDLLPQVKGTDAGDYLLELIPVLYQAKRDVITAESHWRSVQAAVSVMPGVPDHSNAAR